MNFTHKFIQDKCILPWKCLAIRGGRSLTTCCSTKFDLCEINEDSDLWTLWCGDKFNEVRNKFLYSSNIPRICESCYEKEQMNLRSRRVRFRDSIYKYLDKNDKIELQYLDINFSNLCNLNCVMCSSTYSTKWIKYEKIAVKEGMHFRESNQRYLKENHIPEKFLKQIPISNLKIVEVKGGEPLIDPQFRVFLKRFISESGSAIIHITTNLTVLSKNIFRLFTKIPKLAFDISIDGTGDVYRYIRGENINVNIVIENMKKLKKLENLLKIRVNVTTSPYNLWSSWKIIPEVVKHIPDIEINWCPMTTYPKYLSPSLVPEKLRLSAIEIFTEKTKEYMNNKKLLVDVSHTLDYLKKENPEKFPENKIEYYRRCFFKWTDFMNKIRKMNIYKIEPMLGYYRGIVNERYNFH